ncbi:hypothetical protein IVB36_20250 [Bradyrhizobium sp. 35]|uniref:hypothetical protein n=1 Tax=Bradyrhizobium sp. 35 TaxID=2782670 RepID=UPI001FFB5E34|nr:hypothetical protein [Bradyrhizobium sp. 35]MCK1453166.1 hypothetical protein [Bradyrhizobium sp. 35]
MPTGSNHRPYRRIIPFQEHQSQRLSAAFGHQKRGFSDVRVEVIADVGRAPLEVSYGPILLQKLAAMDLAAGPFVEPRFEALALTHFTQL